MNHVGEKPADPLTLLLHPTDGSGEAAFYEDAGDGFGYKRDEYARRSVVCEVSEASIFVRLGKREGSFVPERRSVNLEFRGIGAPENVSANGEEAEWSYEEADERLVVRLAEDAGEVKVEAKF
ncbi:MAG TPA: DUF5110 domain-containing protein [Rubrobacteraceae bacterium]|nr:DUF5110 domain-containing protein [Rubrobacteraceae bacterium]